MWQWQSNNNWWQWKGEAAGEVRCGRRVAWLGSSYSHSLTYICLLEGCEGEGYWRKRP